MNSKRLKKLIKKLIKNQRSLYLKVEKLRPLRNCCLCNQLSNKASSKFIILNTNNKKKIHIHNYHNYCANLFIEYMLKKHNKRLPPNFVFVFPVCASCYQKDVYNTNYYFLEPPPMYFHYNSKYNQYLKLKYYNRRIRTLSANFYYAYSLVLSIIKSKSKPYIFEKKLWERKS